ncbi:MAG: PASTA domain-containing protein [Erysipelotrichaceae bacterium]|nr:PASTA domain-containing protein [Erysipelotrichaceae bacterium]
MADNKDFLDSLAKEVDKKPASFQEERVEKMVHKSFFSLKNIIILVVSLAVIATAVYFVFLRPNISMENFVGKNLTEFSAWAKQNDIDSTGVLVNEEYNFDYDADIIMNQSIAEGEMIKKDAKITLTVSKGADPDELIAFPDIKSMTSEEITAWIKENKLANTKVTSSYDSTVAEGQVISYELKSIEESAFTRGSTLSIVVSKGVKPAATITVSTDYVDQAYTTFKTWADTNKLNVTMTESYSSKIVAGNIISISIKKDDKIKEGDTVTVVVSKGSAVKMIDLGGYTEERITDWCTANDVTVRFKEVYHDSTAKGYETYQTITAGKTVEKTDILTVGISLGKPVLEKTTDITIDDLKLNIAKLNENGANLSINSTYSYEINDDVAAGSIIRISNISSLTVGTQLNLVISRGSNILLSSDWNKVLSGETDPIATESEISELCEANDVNCHITYQQTTDAGLIGKLVSVVRSDTNVKPVGGQYITELDSINIIVYANNAN